MNMRIAVGVCWLSISLLAGCQTGKNSGWSWNKLLSGGEKKSREHSFSDEPDEDIFGERDPGRLMLSDLSPGRIGTTIKSRMGGGENHPLAEQYLAEAKSTYEQALTRWNGGERDKDVYREFRKAARQFQVAAAKWPDSSLEQDALFLQAESHFFANEYILANRVFEILIRRYSGTKHLDLVQSRRFEIAQYWLQLQRRAGWSRGVSIGDSKRPNYDLAGQARRILHRIRLDDPTGKLADDATLALGNAFFEAGRFADAADAYYQLRRNYPGSPHQFHAHLFEMKARLAAYRGPDYDGTDLETADKLMEAMVRQFPDETREQQEYLAKEGRRIRHMLAERDWRLGQYYQRRGENRAAAFHFREITNNYQETALAEQADERLAELIGKPAVPKQYGKWFADLMPSRQSTTSTAAVDDPETVVR